MKKGKNLFFIGLAVLIIGLALMIVGRSMQNSQSYEAGVKAIESGDYATAIELLTPLSKNSYKDSASLLEKAEAAQGDNAQTETAQAESTEEPKGE